VTRLGETPSQTVGPFFHVGMPWRDGPYAVAEDTPGAFWVRGTVIDGEGLPVPDAVVETWQADPAGRFDHPDDPRGAVAGPAGFRGFARCETATDGRYAFLTVKPGALPGGAPHVDVSVFARGLLDRVVTRLYFPGEPANAADPVLASVEPARRDTLVAVADDAGGYRFDIILQGADETVFFAI
jgi:protocatechuate 3,4-dioxygenase alpha subunit